LLQFILPLNYMSNALYNTRKGLRDIQAVITLLHIQPEIVYANPLQSPTVHNPTITFDHVSFGYTPDRLIVNNISFSVPTGSSVALVGPSGSGKSTIAKLIFRFYDVTSGSITLNNHDIRTLAQHTLHQQIGIVPQDIILFNRTLYDNIAYARPDASEQEVHAAARHACLEPFIHSLPDGYLTLIGERGINISGGEKQRIAIARMLLKAPPLCIFDEATSSLDLHTEREIQHTIRTLFNNSTNIIIAHRLSTITHVDQILVLDQGQIVERGTHAELLNKNDLYAQLWNQQNMTNIVSEIQGNGLHSISP